MFQLVYTIFPNNITFLYAAIHWIYPPSSEVSLAISTFTTSIIARLCRLFEHIYVVFIRQTQLELVCLFSALCVSHTPIPWIMSVVSIYPFYLNQALRIDDYYIFVAILFYYPIITLMICAVVGNVARLLSSNQYLAKTLMSCSSR